MSMVTDPLDRSRIDSILSRDAGAGLALAEVVREFRRVSWEGRNDLRRELRNGDYNGLAHTTHSLKGASASLGASDLAQVCGELEMHARHVEFAGSDEFADSDTLMERFETEFTRVQVALMLLVPEG